MGNGTTWHPIKIQLVNSPGQSITYTALYSTNGPNGIDWNTYPAGQALDVVGNIHYTASISDVSDRRLKENFISPNGIYN